MIKLNKLLRLPEMVPCDKRIHALVGTVIAAVLLSIGLAVYVVLIVIVIIAWGIEVYQLVTKSGQYDNWDAVAVVLGGLLVILPILLR